MLKTNCKINFLVFIFMNSMLFSQLVFAQDQDALRAEIYSKISDRRCPTMALDKCNCPEAQAMKAYIDAFLETGTSREDIFYRVARKYSSKVIFDESMRSLVEKRLIKESGGKYSRIVFEPQMLNFGLKSKKEAKVSSTARLYNKGKSNLIISNLRVSCDCVTVSLKTGKSKSPYFGVAGADSGWQAIIEPGKFGDLEVVLDLSHKSMGIGKQIRDIFVSSNDTINPQADLRVEIEIQE